MSGAIGLLLPGQGSQVVGMGRDLAERFPAARETFQEADDALDFALSRVCWEGPESELVRTRIAQPALLVHSVAVWRLVGEALPDVAVAAGHSLGEFSAYVAASAVGFADAVRLVRRRGELMYESGTRRPGGMAAVLGLDDEVVERVCAEACTGDDAVVVPANFNAPGQVVISGDSEALGRAMDGAKAAGSRRVMALNVSGAFHSPLMRVAEPGLVDQLHATPFQAPRFPVVSNVTAEPVDDPSEARRLLAAQLTAPVRWTDSVRTMERMGVERFLEVGAGQVLSGLVRRINKGIPTHAVGTADQVEAFLNHEGDPWN